MTDRVRIREVRVLGEGHGTLRSHRFAYRRDDGSWQEMVRETYDRGNGAAVLPIDAARGTVLLVRQFRFAVHALDPDAMLIEAIAGLSDGSETAETTVRREAQEEAGVGLGHVVHVFDTYPSPGALTERISCFVAAYTETDRTGHGGGLEEEGEDIEVLEMTVTDALDLIARGEIRDAKTIMLLQHARLAGLA